MSTESDPVGHDGGTPSRGCHRSGAAECAAHPARHGFQVPVVKELPRRWDPLTEGEVVSRGTD
jgi:hypothetical protein